MTNKENYNNFINIIKEKVKDNNSNLRLELLNVQNKR